MPNATVDLAIEVSNLTADAIDSVASLLKESPSDLAAFLLREGFSNLAHKEEHFGS